MKKDKFADQPTIKWDRVVVWSGGYDSTYALVEELRKYGCAECWTFKFPGYNEEKFKKEETARNKFKKYVKKLGWKIIHHVIEVNSDIYPSGNLPQQLFWLNLSLLYARKETTLIFGYIKKDDYFEFKEKMEKIKENINKIMYKEVKFEYPLKYKNKWEVVKNIRDAGFEKFVWTCEGIDKDSKKPCGKCVPCDSLKVANIMIKLNKKKEIHEKK